MSTSVTNQIQGIRQSLAVKAPVAAVSSSNLTLSGYQTVDGVAFTANSENKRTLLIAQTDLSENGIYNQDSSGWQRAADFDGNDDIIEGTIVLVNDADVAYRVTSVDPIVIGTDDIEFEQILGLTQSQSTFNALLALSDPYKRTAAEIAASVTPPAYSYEEFYARRYGAPVDGTTSANAAIANADLVAAAATNDADIVFSMGSYAISANLTITSNVKMMPGAMFVVANAVTLKFLGNIESIPQKIFSLTGTGAVMFGSASNQWGNVRTTAVCPEFWGALGVNGGGDDTTAVQACFDSHREFRFYQHYLVTQVTISGNEVTGDFGGFELRGTAATAKTSVLEIKCGYSSIHNIQANAQFNYRYECAIHWYTNNTATFYVGHNRFYGMWPRNALIGLCIGALPSQADPIPAQGTSNAVGIASNAPLSESIIFGFKNYDCLVPVSYRQPNGKITIHGDLGCIAANWAGLYGTSGYTAASARALFMGAEGNELTLVGGSLENVSDNTGAFIDQRGGVLNIIGTTMETCTKSYISGSSYLNIVTACDFGTNFPAVYNAFTVDDGATGQLTISNAVVNYPVEYLNSFSHPFVKCVDGYGGAESANLGNFVVRLAQTELRDTPFWHGASYIPLVKGLDLQINSVSLTSYDDPTVAKLSNFPLNDGSSNLLAGSVDVSNYIITAYGANGNAASGGWTFAVSNAGTCNWGSNASGITCLGKTLDKSLRIQAPAAQTTTATSPKFAIHPEKTYLLRGYIKTGSSANTITIRAYWYKWDNSAASTASTNLISGAESIFGTTAQQLLLRLTPPKDAVKMELFLASAESVDAYYTDLSIT